MTEDELRRGLETGRYTAATLVFKQGMSGWTPAGKVPELGAAAASVPPPPRAAGADEIDYEIFGNEMQYVEVELDPGESAVAEAGAMMYMEDGIEMETIFGDGSSSGGGLMDKLLGAGKRLLTGESLFMTLFGNRSGGKKRVAFAAPYPGKIIPLDLAQLGGSIICQKDAFLCAAKGVSVGIAFQKKIGVALFGGEGFIMERLEGDGLAFANAGGTIVERQLAAGETLRVDTGCIVALMPSVSYDIQFVGGIKSALFGGEGFFFATLTGPGHVWLQSLPFSRLAGRIWQAAPQAGGKDKGEGSILGTLGGIGGIFDGG
jgi:TIGR00266 family protein